MVDVNQAYVKAAQTLDVEAAITAYPYAPRSFYRDPKGKPISFSDYILSGLHTLRVWHPDLFTAEQVAESKAYLQASNYPLPNTK